MKELCAFGTVAAVLAFASSAAAVDCNKWSDHMPGYCGVTSNDQQCASIANRVPGKCAIPSAAWYVNAGQQLIDNNSQTVLAAPGAYELRDVNGNPVALVASGGGNLVASGGGNLVASGGGNVAGRTLQSVGAKKVFVVRK